MCTEASYKYRAERGQCDHAGCKVAIPTNGVVGYRDVVVGDEQALMEAVVQQPVSVVIEADSIAFQLYEDGVFSSDCGSALDHAVLLVGYGTGFGSDYWFIKNSWGMSWGIKGYAKILRGKPGDNGQCGIKTSPSYPVVRGDAPSPPPPWMRHYEHPPCQSDEIEAEVYGTSGEVCAPACPGGTTRSCPTDVPQGTNGAVPQCVLTDTATGLRYCALVCTPRENECPPSATCAPVGFVTTGICVSRETPWEKRVAVLEASLGSVGGLAPLLV
jgi:hypothetical protein